MSETPIVSIVGRPNVGKSSLFNRIVGRRVAVVDDNPGVTRDRNYMATAWNNTDFIVVDTGGLVPTARESITDAIHEQVDIALTESTVVLFVVDATTGPTDLDLIIAKQLRKKAGKKVLLIVNKSESKKVQYEIDSYRQLGLGEPYPVSAIHGKGIGDLLDNTVDLIKLSGAKKKTLKAPEPLTLRVAIVGRPNAGKSSLVNRLLGQNRMIVDSKPGTTRDAIDTPMQYNGKPVLLIDTAGLRKKSHVKLDMEYYANLRAIDSIGRCDICVVLVDVTVGIGEQDLRIISKVFEMRKGLLLAWNKWDIMEKDHKTFDTLVKETRNEYMELQSVPMVSISAKSGQRATAVLDMAFEVHERMQHRIGAAEFEDAVFSWVRVHPHPATPPNQVRFLGAKQVVAPYPVFRFFVTNPEEVVPSYERYLINKIYETFGFEGCPLKLEFRPAAKPRFKGPPVGPADYAGNGE